MAIQRSIANITKALDAGAAPLVVEYFLGKQGYTPQQIKTMMGWAQQMKTNMPTYHLHRWSVGSLSDGYTAPEARRMCLYGHREPGGKFVRTSDVVKVTGREVQTRNSIYILQDVDPEYLQWMGDNDFAYDADNPIPVKKG